MATTTLYTPWNLDSFDPSIAGVAPITKMGTAVDNTQVAAVQAAALANLGYMLSTTAGGVPVTVPAAAVVPPWMPSTQVAANQAMLSPSGVVIIRLAAGVTRSSFDATEAALWTTEGSAAYAPASTAAFAAPSPLGTSRRAATDIFMSTYDTDPASTDQTAAIQAAVTAAAAIITSGTVHTVRIILDSRQTYTIGGAVTAGSDGQWAQIILPYVTSAVARGNIRFVGMPRGNDFAIYTSRSGTVIRSTLGAAPAYQATRGIASIFGGPASYNSAHVAATLAPSRIGIGFQDVTIRSAAPVICGVDAGFLNSLSIDGLLQFDTDWAASQGATAACTAPQAIPLITPLVGANVGTVGDTLCVAGWLCGPVLGDFVHLRRVITFYLSGAALNVDSSDQTARIDYLQDWGNAYGIAATDPGNAIAFSPTAVGAAGKANIVNLSATTVDIGSWNVQTQVAGATPIQRVYDVMDANGVIVIVAVSFDSTDYAFTKNQPVILGVGASVTGPAPYKRIYNKRSNTAPFGLALPASGVVARNPVARDMYVTLTGGTVTAATVNGNAVSNLAAFMIPANASYSVTYSAAPAAQAQVT